MFSQKTRGMKMREHKKVFLRMVVAAFIILALILPAMIYAGTIQLPKTGQTKCYDTAGNQIPCAGTGQDGEIQSRCCLAKSTFS